MYYNLDVLYNKKVSESFDRLTEVIEDVHQRLKDLEYQPVSTKEKRLSWFGVEVKSKRNKIKLFFGTYHIMWDVKEVPLTFFLNMDDEDDKAIKKFMSLADDPERKLFYTEIDGLPCLGIKPDFFHTDGVVDRIVKIFEDVTRDLNFNLRTLK
jgi:hypothetical protein